MTNTPKEEWVYDLIPLLIAFAYDPDTKSQPIIEWVAAHKVQWEKEAGQKAYRGLLDEALNSGNGTYKP